MTKKESISRMLYRKSNEVTGMKKGETPRIKGYCVKCGKKVREIDKYCKKCGKEIIAKIEGTSDYFKSSTVVEFPINEQKDREILGTKAIQHQPIEDDYDG